MKKTLFLVLIGFSYVCESSCTRKRKLVFDDVYAAINGDDAEQLQIFLERDNFDVNDRTIGDGMSLLHIAISLDNQYVATFLFKQGACMENNSIDRHQRRPWHDLLLVGLRWRKIEPNFFELVGDNLTVVDIAGKTPLHEASEYKRILNVAVALNVVAGLNVAVALNVHTQDVLGSAA